MRWSLKSILFFYFILSNTKSCLTLVCSKWWDRIFIASMARKGPKKVTFLVGDVRLRWGFLSRCWDALNLLQFPISFFVFKSQWMWKHKELNCLFWCAEFEIQMTSLFRWLNSFYFWLESFLISEVWEIIIKLGSGEVATLSCRKVNKSSSKAR